MESSALAAPARDRGGDRERLLRALPVRVSGSSNDMVRPFPSGLPESPVHLRVRTE